VRKEIYPVAAWDGMQPNYVEMEGALDLCENGTDTERWVGCVCVYVRVCACGNGGVLNVFGRGISPKFM
jgi:hypothetical protein